MTSDKEKEIRTQSTSSDSATDAAIKKYLPYLQEIQKKLITLLIVILVSGVSGFFYYQKILSFILGIFNLKGVTIILSSPYQFIDLAINTGIATGIIVALPLLIYYLLSFLKPALVASELRFLIRLVPLFIFLFILGFAFGVWVMQFVINIYSQTALDLNVSNLWDIGRFFSQIIIMGISLGFLFELPVVVTILIKLKLVKSQTIARHRRFVYAGIVVLAALLPPSDVVSLCILAIVPLFLFELALLLNKSI